MTTFVLYLYNYYCYRLSSQHKAPLKDTNRIVSRVAKKKDPKFADYRPNYDSQKRFSVNRTILGVAPFSLIEP